MKFDSHHLRSAVIGWLIALLIFAVTTHLRAGH
jgi:hypothetical protein